MNVFCTELSRGFAAPDSVATVFALSGGTASSATKTAEEAKIVLHPGQ